MAENKRYENRWHMVLEGIRYQFYDPNNIKRLSESYQNWSPLEVHIYQTGVVAGFVCGFISCAIFVIVYLALLGKL